MITTSDLKDLRARLRAVGAFERTESKSLLKMTLMLSTAGALIALQGLAGGWALWALMPLTALFVVGGVMVGHEGGHKSFSESPWRNELLLHFCFPLVSGLSATYWKHKHNVMHHAHPNIVGKDHDLEFWPMAGCKADYDNSGPLRRVMQRRFQAYLFWPLSGLLTVSMRLSSLDHLFRHAKKRGRTMAWWIDLSCLVGHYTFWLVLPAFAVGFGLALGFYLVLWFAVSVYLSAIFSPAHLGLPVLNSHPDRWRLQLESTRNLKMPAWLGVFFVGLDHQIQHHLFPRMSHLKFPVAAPVVRSWAAERNLPFKGIDYWAGLVEVTRYARDAWKRAAVEPLEEPARPEVGELRAA